MKNHCKRISSIFLFYPIKLNRIFLIATLFGQSELSQEILLDFFLAYLSKDERAFVMHALDNTLDDEQSDEWLDFLDLTVIEFQAQRNAGSTVEMGVGRVITPGPEPRRGPQKIQSMKIYHIL